MNKQIAACILFAALAAAAVTGCSGAKSRATCFDCTTTPQKWSAFDFPRLEGTWRGTQNVSVNDAGAAKVVTKEKQVEVTFLEGRKFLRAYKIAEGGCAGFPAEAVVLLNELWWDRASAQPSDQRAFEVFGKLEGDKVGYGRAYIKRSPNGNTCEYLANERPIVMNRLALPAVAYSKRLTADGRALASGTTQEVDVSLEFLNFDQAKGASEHRFSGKKEKEAPLFFRFVKTTREVNGAFDDGNWQATEEKLFRLWRVN